ITKTPPAAVLLKQAAGIDKASGEPNKNKIATVKRDKVKEIAETKMQDLNAADVRSEEHTSELQSRFDLVCRLLLEKKNKNLKQIQLIINHKDLTGIDKVCNDIEGIV